MITPQTIGYFCLNIALIIYLIHYLPQLRHNQNRENQRQINLNFHGLLSVSYLTDLIFAVGMSMPWQYCLVSGIGVGCLLTQHMQLKSLYSGCQLYQFYQNVILSLIVMLALSLYIKLPEPFFLAMGYFTQLSIWSYSLPQIWQNYRYKQGRGLSPVYLCMNLFCYTLDIIASMTLDWPLPAKMGAIFGLFCTTILMTQRLFSAKPKANVKPALSANMS